MNLPQLLQTPRRRAASNYRTGVSREVNARGQPGLRAGIDRGAAAEGYTGVSVLEAGQSRRRVVGERDASPQTVLEERHVQSEDDVVLRGARGGGLAWPSGWSLRRVSISSPRSAAQALAPQVGASTPVTGAIDAQTFRNVAKAASPTVVNIRTTSKRRAQNLSDFFGSGRSVQPVLPQSRSSRAKRPRSRRAPGSSSARTATSSRTTTWWKGRPRSRWPSSATSRTRRIWPRSSAATS